MKKLLFILISIIVGIVIAVVSLEVFLRLNQNFGYIRHSFNRLGDERAPHIKHFATHSYRPSPLLGYEQIPNSESIYGHINSYGMLGKEYKLEKKKGIYRILVLGDSIAAQGWPCEFLEKELNDNPLLRSKYTFEIWNAGAGSYDVRRYALYLKHKGLQYKPDMVIIFFCLNDFYPDLNIYYKNRNGAIAYDFPLLGISKRYPVNPFLMKQSFLYRFIILKLNSYLLSKQKQPGVYSKEEEAGRFYLGILRKTCEENKISLFAVIFPYLKPLDAYKNYELNEYKTICKVTKDLGVNYLNLYEVLQTGGLYDLRNNIKDQVHPSREGHRLIAKIIYDYLLRNYLDIH